MRTTVRRTRGQKPCLGLGVMRPESVLEKEAAFQSPEPGGKAALNRVDGSMTGKAPDAM